MAKKSRPNKKYAGKYVAMRDFNNRKVIVSDKDPLKVMKKAKKKGVEDPLIVYVRKPGESFLYNAA